MRSIILCYFIIGVLLSACKQGGLPHHACENEFFVNGGIDHLLDRERMLGSSICFQRMNYRIADSLSGFTNKEILSRKDLSGIADLRVAIRKRDYNLIPTVWEYAFDDESGKVSLLQVTSDVPLYTLPGDTSTYGAELFLEHYQILKSNFERAISECGFKSDDLVISEQESGSDRKSVRWKCEYFDAHLSFGVYTKTSMGVRLWLKFLNN